MRNIQVDITPPPIPYPMVVMQEEGTDGSLVYRAEIPDLPGCMSHGDTFEEALENLREAMQLYIEVLREQGRPIPGVSRAPVTLGTAFSEQSSDIQANLALIR